MRALFKALPAHMRALKSYRQRDDKEALRYFEEFLRWYQTPVAEYAAFHATLLVLNHRSTDAKRVFEDVLRTQFPHPRNPVHMRYTKLYSHYYLALIGKRQDAIERWLEAKKHLPQNGFASRYLMLPDNPLP